MESLTREQLESIVIAITLWNNSSLKFNKDYLKYANMFEGVVEQTEDFITITVDPASVRLD